MNDMKKIGLFLLAVAILMVFDSCAYKRLGYLQDMEADIAYSMPQQPEAKIAKGDRIKIIVNCATPELADPFNVMNGTFNPGVSAAGAASTVTEDESLIGFEVNKDGDIIYPILGTLHVEGLTLKQLKQLIETSIKEKKYIYEPVVTCCFTNFKITILGESGSNIYTIPEGAINIFDALAKAKDLTEDAERGEVWVVRSREGVRKLYKINLKSKDCYYSPAFFLQQNDMIYAKPRATKHDAATKNGWTVASTVLSAIGVSTSLVVLVMNYVAMQQR